MITTVNLRPGNKEKVLVKTALKIGQSNCGTNCLQRRWRLSAVDHIFLYVKKSEGFFGGGDETSKSGRK